MSEKQIPFWPSWNTKNGRDYDLEDVQPPTDHQAVYAQLRETAKKEWTEKRAQRR